MVGARIPKLTDVTVRLAAMDAQGVDRQWVSASPNHFYPWAPEGLAVWVANEANRLVAEHVAQAPDRLTGLGLVPLQHPEPHRSSASTTPCSAAGSRASRSRRSPGDVELSDPRLEPFWARADELGAVVFLHPFGCSLDERLDRFYLSNTVGQPDRERRRAVAPDLLGRAGPASGSEDRRRARRRIPARSRSGAPTARGGSGPRRGGASTSRRPTCASSGSTPSCTTRARCGTSSRSPGGSQVAARQRLPVRHGPRRPGRRHPVGRAARRDHARASSARTPTSCSRPRCGHEDRRAGVSSGAETSRRGLRDRRPRRAVPRRADGRGCARAGVWMPRTTLSRRSLSERSEPGRPARRRPAARTARAGRDPRLRRVRGARRGRERRRSTARARSCPSGTRRRPSTSRTRTPCSAPASRCRRRSPSGSTSSSSSPR